MNFKSILLSTVLSFTIVGYASSAQLTVTSDVNLPAGDTYDGNTISGIVVNTNNLGNDWLVTTGGNITSSNNLVSGFQVEGGGKANVSGATNGSNKLIIVGNTAVGIHVNNANSSLTIENMDIDLINNSQRGIYVTDSGLLNIKSSVPNNKIVIDNSLFGTLIDGSGSKFLINAMDFAITRSANHGLYASSGGDILFKGDTGTPNLLDITNNVGMGVSSDSNAKIQIENMNINSSYNNVGLASSSDSFINIYGNDNTSLITNNNVVGIATSANGSITVKDSNIHSNNNTSYGIVSNTGGNINLVGNTAVLNTLETLNNDTGMSAINGSTISITDMNVNSNNNGSVGILAESGGNIKIEGVLTGNNILNLIDNVTAGVVSDGLLGTSFVELKNMNINISGSSNAITSNGNAGVNVVGMGANTINITNTSSPTGSGVISTDGSNISVSGTNTQMTGIYYGVRANTGGSVNFSSKLGYDNLLYINSDSYSLAAGDVNSNINISEMDVNVNASSTAGSNSNIYARNDAVINFAGKTTGLYNVLTSSSGGVYGFLSTSLAQINVSNMNIIANQNNKNNIFADGGSITFKGILTGNNIINADSSLFGHGIISSGTNSKVSIEDMDVSSNFNALDGINTISTGVVDISTVTSKILSASNNSRFGIYAQDTLSKVDITNMNVVVDTNNSNNIYAKSGGVINIVGDMNGNNSLSASYSSAGSGVFTRDLDSEININNMDVITNNNQKGITTSGGLIKIVGSTNRVNSLIANQNVFDGIQSTGSASSLVDIKFMDIYAQDNTRYGINAHNTGAQIKILGSAAKNNMYLSGNTLYALYSGESTTLVDIKNYNVFSINNDFANVVDGASMNFENADIVQTTANKGFVVEGSGSIKLDKSDFITNGTSLMEVKEFGSSFGSATLTANDNTIQGSVTTVAGMLSNMGLTNTVWNMKATSNVSNMIASNSTIDLRGANYNTLTLDSYAGAGNKIQLRTQLGGDISSTDKLILDGFAYTNTSDLEIFGTGMGGITHNGIKVVDAINGATTQSNSFSLVGGVVDTGAVEYNLYRGDVDGIDGESWYLRSSGHFSNLTKAMVNEPVTIISIAKTGMNSLHKRMGELRETSPLLHDAIWVRTFAKNLTVEDGLKAKMNLFGTEAGYDHRFDLEKAKIYLGAMVGYMDVSDIKNNQTNGAKDGAGDGDAKSVGIYATYLNQNGWFADAVVRNFWEDIDLTSYTALNLPVNYNLDRMVTAYSFEVGKQYKYCLDCSSMFIVEPKVELMYANARGESFHNSLGSNIKYGHTESFTSKAALMLGYKKRLGDDRVIEPYIQAGVIHEWMGKTNVIFDNVETESDLSGTSYEVGVGLNMQLNKNISMFGDVMYERGSNVKALSGNLGLRYNF